jgi:hypothetical protein
MTLLGLIIMKVILLALVGIYAYALYYRVLYDYYSAISTHQRNSRLTSL